MKTKFPITNILLLLLILLFFQFSYAIDPEKWLDTKNEKGFLENRGQMVDNENNTIPNVLFKTEAPNLNIWITTKGMVIQTLNLRKVPKTDSELTEMDKQEEKESGKRKTNKFWDWERVDIELANANIKKENILKENPLPENFNFFYAHCPDGVYGVKEYEKITIKDVYSNIDWVLYRKADGSFKYDFAVHPGADYKQIKLLYKSKTPININEQGEIELYTAHGDLKENRPVSFYEDKEVVTKFKQGAQKSISINGDQGYETRISFELNLEHETVNSKLIIDPELTWSTFYGGTWNDGSNSVDTDDAGNVFITGYTESTNFPTQNAGTFFQESHSGGGSTDAFLIKFDNAGNRLWVTYYGGSDIDRAHSIDTDAAGNVFITGNTSSTDFPTQNAGTFFQGTNSKWRDAFILKFDNAGNRLWATYYGGNGNDEVFCIATDAAGNVFVTGYTGSIDFPTQDAGTFFQGANAGSADAFILKFDNVGNCLWATHYGGTGWELGHFITIDAVGNVFVIGYTGSIDFPTQDAGTFFQGANAGVSSTDAFILKFDNAGNRLWSTYYGGSDIDRAHSIDTDAAGNVFVMGITASIDFPTQNAGTFFQGTNAGRNDVFILKFDNTGNRLWATYYGGNRIEAIYSFDNLATDNCGNLYLSFTTFSNNIAAQVSCSAGYFDNTLDGIRDQFIVLFSNTGVLNWATYLGGDGDDYRCPLAVDNGNNLFVFGEWTDVNNAANYPLINPGGGAYYDATHNGSDDAFIMKFIPPTPIISESIVAADCLLNGSATVTVSGLCPPFDYVWSNGGSTMASLDTFNTVSNLAAGNYMVTIQTACDTIMRNIVINGSDSFTDSLSTTICVGETFTLPDGAVISAAGTYIDTLASSGGCDSIITTILTVSSSIMSNQNATVCDGETFTLPGGTAVNTAGTYIDTLSSSEGCDSIITTILTVSLSIVSNQNASICAGQTFTLPGGVVVNISGTYTDTLASSGGCDSIITTTLVIHPIPTVTTSDNVTIRLGQSTALSSAGSGGTLTWTPPTWLSCVVCPSPMSTPEQTITYTATIVDSNGCVASNDVTVIVDFDIVIFVPNIFSPNGDGNNDVLYVRGAGVEALNFVIYNRWGENVFESTSLDIGWDGTFRGKAMNSAVFNYYLKATFIDGTQTEQKGDITLVR